METTRPAHETDRDVCVTLLTHALDDARAGRGGVTLTGDATPDALWARWCTTGSGTPAPATVLYVGQFERAVVGLGAATAVTRAGTGELSGRVECCYVEAAARGVGVGSALMASLVARCTGQGCHDIDALALPGDRLSKQRLEAAGFTARLLVLNRPLS